MKTIIIGGGIIGVATAYYLAKAGDDVTVVERLPGVAQETSFANAGLISPGHSYTWASPQAPLVLLKSLFKDGQALKLKLVPDLRMYAWGLQFLKNCTNEKAYFYTARKAHLSRYSQKQLQHVTVAEDLKYEKISKGLLYLHRDQTALDRAAQNMRVMIENGIDLKVLTPTEIVALEPALAASSEHLAGGLYCPTDETGDAHLFSRALFERCKSLGVTFLFDTEIKGFEVEASTIRSVTTSRGKLVADRYVLAAGSQSPIIARPLGYKLPVYPVKGYSVTFPISAQHQPPVLGGLDEHNLIAWARFGNRLRFTATAEFAGYDKSHKPSDFHNTIAAAQQLFPKGADYSEPTYWTGLRPMTPSGTPILGRSRHANLYFNTGHGHLGWTWSCGTSKLVSDLMIGHTPEIDLKNFAYRA
jgi:D-amino-acid dehydrogenase